MRVASIVIELLTSDPAILAFSCIGLAATAVSILRDARSQREALVVPENVHQLVPDDVPEAA